MRAIAVPLQLALLMTCAASAAAQPQPPAGYGPVSITLEDLPYPHPVSYLPLTVYGQDVRMAYMDVAPAAPPNGRTVVLLHGMNFFGEYWAATIDALRRDGFRVVVPDQIGYGRSSKPIIPYTLHDMARTRGACCSTSASTKRRSSATRWAAWLRHASPSRTPT